MPLGQHFPEELLRQRLVPGRILHLYCQFAGKEKFVVLGSVNPEPLVFAINSRIHPYVAGKQHLARCHDSFIACHEVQPMLLHEIYEQMRADPSRIKSMVSNSVHTEIVAAVKYARTISRHHQDQVIAALGTEI